MGETGARREMAGRGRAAMERKKERWADEGDSDSAASGLDIG